MDDKTEQLKKGALFADEHAAKWDEISDQLWAEGPRADAFDFFCQYVGTGPKRVLDLGCGAGSSTVRLMQSGYQAIGVDQSPKMIEAAKRRGVEAYVSDSLPLPFADGEFDAVFVCTVLEWTAQPAAVMREVLRVLKPGGQVVTTILGPCVKARGEAYVRLHGQPTEHNMMMPWELHRLLEELEVNVEEMHGVYPPYVPQEVIDQLSAWQMRSALAFLWTFGSTKPTQKI